MLELNFECLGVDCAKRVLGLIDHPGFESGSSGFECLRKKVVSFLLEKGENVE